MSDTNAGPSRLQRHRRARVQVPVRISTIDPETNPETGRPYFSSAEAVSLDISRGGIFVSTDEPLSPGRRLLVELDLPGGASLQTIGRVAWSRMRVPGESADVHAGVGVEFMGGPSKDLSQLVRFVDRASRRHRTTEGDPRSAVVSTAGPGA